MSAACGADNAEVASSPALPPPVQQFQHTAHAGGAESDTAVGCSHWQGVCMSAANADDANLHSHSHTTHSVSDVGNWPWLLECLVALVAWSPFGCLVFLRWLPGCLIALVTMMPGCRSCLVAMIAWLPWLLNRLAP